MDFKDFIEKKRPIEVKTLCDEENLLPTYATKGASGADVRANIKESIVIAPGKYARIPTGLKMEVPFGFEIQVRPRSGLAAKSGITVLNTPGTIDSDYRGPIEVILINLGDCPFIVEPLMRIAQIVLCPIYQANFTISNELALSERASGGFGSSGTK